MGLSSIVGALRDHLAATLPSPPALIGAVAPAAPGDLPAIVASVSDATQPARSLGKIPGPVRTGALRITAAVDLAHPQVVFGGESVNLLSADRRTVQIPHGSVVRADGLSDQPFTTTDLTVRLGVNVFVPAAPPPSAGTTVGLDPAAGVLTFRDPLPATGTLELGYFVGTWEVRGERFKATMTLQVFAASAGAVETLCHDVEGALTPEKAGPAGFCAVDGLAVGAIVGVAPPAGAFSRRLDFAVDFEHIEPVIRTAGGPIREIDVAGTPAEPFVVK